MLETNQSPTPTGEIELVVERYWLDGMSLDQARRRALKERHWSAGAQDEQVASRS